MKKVTTESTSVYLLDEENKRFYRIPRTDAHLLENDNFWAGYHAIAKLELGSPMELVWESSEGPKFRITTNVIEIVESDGTILELDSPKEEDVSVEDSSDTVSEEA
jgi:hypothetical protein